MFSKHYLLSDRCLSLSIFSLGGILSSAFIKAGTNCLTDDSWALPIGGTLVVSTMISGLFVVWSDIFGIRTASRIYGMGGYKELEEMPLEDIVSPV